MNLEEILLKLGLDNTAFARGLRGATEGLNSFVEKAEHGLVHVGSQGRALHKIFDQLKESAPLLGNALQIALSPITGTMIAAGAAFAFVHEKLKEINAELDKQALENLRPIGDAWQTQRELSKKVNETIEEQNKWLREQKELGKQTLKTTLEKLEAEEKLHGVKKKHLEIDKETAEALKKTALSAEKKAASAYIEAPEQEKLLKGREAAATSKEQLDQAIKERNALKIASAKASEAETAGFKLLPNWQELKDMASKLVGQSGLEESLQRAEDKVKSLTFEYHKNTSNVDKFEEKLKKLKEAWDESKKSVEQLTPQLKAQADYERNLSQGRKNLAEAQNAPYQATASEAEQFNTPYGYLARELALRQQGAKVAGTMANWGEIGSLQQQLNANTAQLRTEAGQAMYAGDAKGLQAAFRRSAEGIRKIMGDRVAPDRHLETIAEQITKLNESAKGEGLIVRGSDNS